MPLLADAEPGEGFAALAAELARVLFFRGDERAQQRVDQAIDVAERLWLPHTLSMALNTAGLIASVGGRPEYGSRADRAFPPDRARERPAEPGAARIQQPD